MKTFLVFLLTVTAWIHPISAVSAKKAEPITSTKPIQVEVPALKPIVDEPKIPITKADPKRAEKPVSKGTDKPAPTPSTNGYSGRIYSKDEIVQLIKSYSNIYGIDSSAPLCIAKLESGYNQFSANKSSSARGVFQYLSTTWRATDEGKAGLSVFDADANVRAAIKYMASRHSAAPWVVVLLPKDPIN